MKKYLIWIFIGICFLFSATSVFAYGGNDLSYGIMDSDYEMLFNEAVLLIKDNQHARAVGDLSTDLDRILAKRPNLKTRGSLDSLGDYIYDRLNDQEKALFRSNKVKGLLCLANGKLATEYEKKHYAISYDTRNANRNAFKHALWNYGMAQDVGYDFAKEWSDAHEYGDIYAPELERKMDLHNNSLGLSLRWEHGFTWSHAAFRNNTLQAIRQGRGLIIDGTRLIRSSNAGEL